MIKDFQGQVKVADIQAAFDEIVNRINKQVDIYNNAAGYGDIDYTKGSPKLGSGNYTLTIGGLKSVINSYNDTLIGCRAYRLNDTSILISDGLYFKDGQVYRINSRVVVGEANWDLSDLYYDIDNDAVIFKNGSTSDIVEVQAGWTQPTINSNTDCGIFTANSNSQDAYKVTSSGWEPIISQVAVYGENSLFPSGNCNVSWNLPKTIKDATISFHIAMRITMGGVLTVNANGNILYSETFSPTEYSTIEKDITISDIEQIDSLIINVYLGDGRNSATLAPPIISNLTITGNANSYAIETGGVITPSDNIIKISHLNWESGNLILNSLEGFQLEGFHDVKLTSQNRSINQLGQGWETIDTSSSPKFVAYTTRLATGRLNIYGTTSFMGLTLNNARDEGDSPHRAHWIATALSLIFIPKGFNIIDEASGYCGRFVYSAKLSK